jgi:antitoxin component YwqK of YwqJK toxin-antitoxin module
MSGLYLKGSPEGIWTYFDEKGKVTRKETYEKGYLLKKEGELEKDDSIGGPK